MHLDSAFIARAVQARIEGTMVPMRVTDGRSWEERFEVFDAASLRLHFMDIVRARDGLRYADLHSMAGGFWFSVCGRIAWQSSAVLDEMTLDVWELAWDTANNMRRAYGND